MLLTLFYIFLIGWIAGVIHFFNIGNWNWALLGVAILFLVIRRATRRRGLHPGHPAHP